MSSSDIIDIMSLVDKKKLLDALIKIKKIVDEAIPQIVVESDKEGGRMISEKREVELNKEIFTLLNNGLTDFNKAVKDIAEHYEDKEEAVFAGALYGGMWADW